MNYTKLTAAQQRSHIEDQIAFLERQHFDAALKLRQLSAIATPDTATIAQLTANLADFDAMHAVAQTELHNIDTALGTSDDATTDAVADSTVTD